MCVFAYIILFKCVHVCVSLNFWSCVHVCVCLYVTGYGKTDHFAHYFKIELLVFRGSVDLKQ